MGVSPTALPCCYGHRPSREGPSSSRMWNKFRLFFCNYYFSISKPALTDCTGARTGWGQAETGGFTRNQSGGQKVGGMAGSTGGAGALLMGLWAQSRGEDQGKGQRQRTLDAALGRNISSLQSGFIRITRLQSEQKANDSADNPQECMSVRLRSFLAVARSARDNHETS